MTDRTGLLIAHPGEQSFATLCVLSFN